MEKRTLVFILVLLWTEIYVVSEVGYIYIRYLPTNQTGGYTDGYGIYHGSNLANDWDLQTCAEPINPSGTPKWYIDIQDFYAVISVTAFNQDSNANFNSVPRYLSYFYVRVGNSTDLNSQTQCCYYNDVVPVGGNVTCTCQSPIIGRYISIERTGGENPQALVICEVLVQGYKTIVSGTSTTTSTTSTASSTSTTMSSTTTTKLTSLSTAPQSLSTAVQTISSTGSSALIPPSTLPTTSTNDTQPMNAGSVAAVVMGILFGICLVAVVILAIHIVRSQRQNKPNIYATNAAIAEPQRDYEMLRTMHESPREVEPPQIESKITESIESSYEEVNIAASSI